MYMFFQLCIIVFFKILLVVLLFGSIKKYLCPIVRKSLNYYKQNPYNVLSCEHPEHGKLLISFYTYYSYRPFFRDVHVFNMFFSKRYKPVQIDVYEKAVIVQGVESYIIDKCQKIFIKRLPVLNTETGMFDFYNEHINFPIFYKNHFHEIFITDMLGKDKFSKLILTPVLANCFKEHLEVIEIVAEELQPICINK